MIDRLTVHQERMSMNISVVSTELRRVSVCKMPGTHFSYHSYK